jgi:hypothetical protein
MEKICVPAPAPSDAEECIAIDKLVEYVSRNGVAFEEKVKLNEVANPKFSFLYEEQNQAGYSYYQWRLFCVRRRYTPDQVHAIENVHTAKLEACQPGYMSLLDSDTSALSTLLTNNNGSKDTVKSFRKWILTRAHSLAAIAFEFMGFLDMFAATQQGAGAVIYQKVLHSIYIINDVLFNGSNATTLGPYTAILQGKAQPVNCAALFLPILPRILHCGCQNAQNDVDKGKINKMVALWQTRAFINENMAASLLAAIMDPAPPLPPPVPVLMSPLPTNLPPPNSTNGMMTMQPNAPGAPSMVYPGAPHLPSPPLMHPPMHPGMPFSAPHQMPPQAQPLPGMVPPQAQPLPGMVPPQAQPLPGMLPPGMIGAPQMPMPPGMHPGMHPGYPTPLMPQMPQMPHMGLNMPPANAQSHGPLLSPALDLNRISVGNMVNIVKAAVKAGHPKYEPINPADFAGNVAPYVEPGRLDIRINDFYKKAEKMLETYDVPADALEVASYGNMDSVGNREAGRYSDSNHRGDAGNDQAGYFSAPSSGNSLMPPPQSSGPLDESNMGHQIMSKLGWSQGSGLGAGGAGIVDPVEAAGNKGKSGVGLDGMYEVEQEDFEAYRQKRSSEYFTKIDQRETRR